MSECGECGRFRDTNPNTDNCLDCDAKIAAKYPQPRISFNLVARAQKGNWNPHFLKSLQGGESDG